MSSNATIDLLTVSSAAAAADPEADPGPRLEEFTLFPKMPLELRRKIFRRTFNKSSHVRLYYWPDFGSIDTKRRCWWERAGTLPAALHVCHESRVEALMHYQIVLYDKVEAVSIHPMPGGELSSGNNITQKHFWFNSRSDSAYINMIDCFYYDSCDNFYWALKDLTSNGREVASTFRELEIRLLPIPNRRRKLPTWILDFIDKGGEYFRNLLMLFKGLQTLCFSYQRSDLALAARIPVGFLAEVEKWLEENKAHFATGKPPKVYLVNVATDNNGEAAMPIVPLPA